jgi:hypothetical protein
MKRDKIKGFLVGFLACALLVGLAFPSLAAGSLTTLRDVLVGGITIVIDGQELRPTDANGNPVDPMIYNGTTYLPVRAVSSALGKAVYWDGPTYTVYLGDMDGTLEYPTVMLKDMTNIGKELASARKLVDNYGNSYGSAFYASYYEATAEYLLNMKYSKFRGTLYIPEGTASNGTSSLTITADGKQIYTSPILDKTSAPIQIDVNVTGCNDLKITFQGNFHFCLADAGFYQ